MSMCRRVLIGPTLLSLAFAQFTQAQENVPILNAQAPAAAASNEDPSYLVGYQIGSNLASSGFVETDIIGSGLLRGLMDALAKRKPALNDAQLRAAAEALDQKIEARVANLAVDNLNRSKAFLEANSKKDGVQTLKSGLQYKVLNKGQGKTPTQTSVVRVHYEGKLVNGEVFDSSIQRGEPAEFPVNRVIAGWTEALQRMAVGDKWQLFIPPDLAYGPQGSPGAIGPNEALIFEVELLEVVR